MPATRIEASDASRAPFYGWRILALASITGALTAPGQTIGVSVFVDHFIRDLAVSRTDVAAAYLAGTLLGALSLPAVGRWIDRSGVRHAMTAIGIGFGLALVFMASVSSLLTLALGFTLIRFLGQGSLALVSTVAVTHWFRARRGFALGLQATAIGGLIALAPIALNFSIGATSWRLTWVFASVVVLMTVVPIARLGIVNRPEDVDQSADGATQGRGSHRSAATRRSSTRREALRHSKLWVLLAALASTSMLVTALNFHQISLLGEAGLSATAAAAMFLPQVVGTSVASVLFGWLADRLQGLYLVAGSMVLLATSLVLASIVTPGWSVIVYAVVLGAAGGAFRAVGATLPPAWFGTAHIGSIQGMISFTGVAASAVGPLVLSVGQSSFGSFGAVTPVLASLPVVVALVAIGREAGAPADSHT